MRVNPGILLFIFIIIALVKVGSGSDAFDDLFSVLTEEIPFHEVTPTVAVYDTPKSPENLEPYVDNTIVSLNGIDDATEDEILMENVELLSSENIEITSENIGLETHNLSVSSNIVPEVNDEMIQVDSESIPEVIEPEPMYVNNSEPVILDSSEITNDYKLEDIIDIVEVSTISKLESEETNENENHRYYEELLALNKMMMLEIMTLKDQLNQVHVKLDTIQHVIELSRRVERQESQNKLDKTDREEVTTTIEHQQQHKQPKESPNSLINRVLIASMSITEKMLSSTIANDILYHGMNLYYDYIDPIVFYITDTAHFVSYYIVTYYDSENLGYRLKETSIWLLDILQGSLAGGLSSVMMLCGVALCILAIIVCMMNIKSILKSLFAGIIMVLLSPILLVLYIFVDIPRKYFGSTKKKKKSKAMKNE